MRMPAEKNKATPLKELVRVIGVDNAKPATLAFLVNNFKEISILIWRSVDAGDLQSYRKLWQMVVDALDSRDSCGACQIAERPHLVIVFPDPSGDPQIAIYTQLARLGESLSIEQHPADRALGALLDKRGDVKHLCRGPVGHGD